MAFFVVLTAARPRLERRVDVGVSDRTHFSNSGKAHVLTKIYATVCGAVVQSNSSAALRRRNAIPRVALLVLVRAM